MSAATKADALAHAIEWLGAVEVEPGRYAFAMPCGIEAKRSRWMTVSFDAIERYAETANLEALVRGSVLMTAWWSPDTRATWFCDRCGRTTGYVMKHLTSDGCRLRHIAVDLATGQEIPA